MSESVGPLGTSSNAFGSWLATAVRPFAWRLTVSHISELVPTEKSVLVAAVDVTADGRYASRHNLGAALIPLDPANTDTFACRAPTRNPGLAAPAGSAAAQRPPTGAAREDGPLALGPALAPMDRMADGARDRHAGDRHCVAPTQFPTVVDLEESASPRAPDSARQHPHPDSRDGRGEPALGRAADARRTAEARHRRVSGDRREIHGLSPPGTLADVAHVPEQSRRSARRRRFLRGPR